MRCFICHNDVIGLEILAMGTRCKKGLITYHKFNGITTMKKHVESNHLALLKKLVEDPSIVSAKAPFDRKPNKKGTCRNFIVCCLYGPQIAVEGCAHGDLDNIYATLQYLEHTNNIKIELLICCGDFQVQIYLVQHILCD